MEPSSYLPERPLARPTPGGPSPDDELCECGQGGLSRRSVLQGFAGVAAATVSTALIGDVFTEVAYGATTESPNVLVVLSLRGGADGLSLVVPHGDAGYLAARPRIAIPPAQLLAKDAMFGLHPGFAPLLPMWEAGRFGAVHAAGLPAPNRSHFAAMDAVEDADPGSSERRGWLNRMIGLIGGSDPEQGVQVGNGIVPTLLYGPEAALSLTDLGAVRLPGGGTEWEPHIRQSLQTTWARAKPPLGRSARAALDVSKRLEFLADLTPPQNGAEYPGGGSALGAALAQTAQLIRAQVGARVVAIDYGGWDMHIGIGPAGAGMMWRQVDELARALNAFFVDLGALGETVTVVTISEFGRRVGENGSIGLDHGYGNCMLALGGGIRGGQVYTRWPGLGDGELLEGDLRVTVDHRSVLAEVVRSRFPNLALNEVFPQFQPETVGIA